MMEASLVGSAVPMPRRSGQGARDASRAGIGLQGSRVRVRGGNVVVVSYLTEYVLTKHGCHISKCGLGMVTSTFVAQKDS